MIFNKYKIVILDEDEMAIDELVFAMNSFSSIEIVGTSRSGSAGKKVILNKKPDLLFIEAELPDISGINLLESISNDIDWPMKVVIFTKSKDYMLDALRKGFFDYLLKPFNLIDLKTILFRFCDQSVEKDVFMDKGESNGREYVTGNNLILSTAGAMRRVVKINEVGFFEYNSECRQWIARLVDHSKIYIKKNTSAKMIVSRSAYLIQTHQSYIVNVNFLKSIKGNICYLYPPFEQSIEIPIAKSERKKIEQKILDI